MYDTRNRASDTASAGAVGVSLQHVMQVDGSKSMAEVADAIDKCFEKLEREKS